MDTVHELSKALGADRILRKDAVVVNRINTGDIASIREPPGHPAAVVVE